MVGSTVLGGAQKEVVSVVVSCVLQKIFLQESVIALNFLRLKLKCIFSILLVLSLGTLAFFTGVSCS